MGRRVRQPGDGPEGDGVRVWELRLFVAGTGMEVEQVQEALDRVCQEHLPGRYRVMRVDVLQDPEQADAFDIVAVPTVIRQAPPPVRRIIGDLSQVQKVVHGLGIPVPQES